MRVAQFPGAMLLRRVNFVRWALYLWARRVELASCPPSGSYNSKAVATILENL